MITIYFERQRDILSRKDIISNPSVVYKKAFKKEWYDDPMVIEVLHRIDHVPEAVKPTVEWFISQHRAPWDICTGSKNVIMTKFLDGMAPLLQYMGENCYPYIFDISNEKNIIIYSSMLQSFLTKLWKEHPADLYAPQLEMHVTDIWTWVDMFEEIEEKLVDKLTV